MGWISGNSIVIDILVAKFEKPEFDSSGKLSKRGRFLLGNNQRWLKALLDTGATESVISSELVEELNLKPIGKRKICTASSNEIEVFAYEAGIGVKLVAGVRKTQNQTQELGTIKWYPIIVTGNEAIKHQGLDAIIGMDIIMSGQLTVSGDVFILSI